VKREKEKGAKESKKGKKENISRASYRMFKKKGEELQKTIK